eukprot:1662322-Pyramimonas_sp.AAC.1
MQQHCGRGKAGEITAHQAIVGPITWGEDDGPGKGTLTLAGSDTRARGPRTSSSGRALSST